MDALHLNPPLLTLEVIPESGVLRATFDPTLNEMSPSLDALKDLLKVHGYSEYYLDDQSIDKFIQDCSSCKQAVIAEIGERRNATFSIEISADLMAAWLTLTRAQGGGPIGIQIQDELRDREITHGVLHAEINAVLARGWCDHQLIAQGEPVQPGILGSYEVLFGVQEKSTPSVDDRAIVKFRDLSHLLLVHAADPLMRIRPTIQGKNGKNIKGQIVLADPVPDLKFGPDLLGSVPDKQDANLLVAIHAGQPVEVSNGVIVNPVITVPHVDLSTGKIQFEGTVHVEGDVKTGMSINVTGDVIVNGMVESAEIIAGGNVAVKGGVIGRAEKKAGTQNLSDSAAKIKCAGSVQAMFMENVHVEAGNSIIIDQNARHCELIARQEITVGKSGSRGGQIVGGRAQASLLIQTDVIGSNTATKTRIQVGVDPYLEEQITKKQEVIQKKVAELDQVLKLIVFFERNPQKNVDGVAKKVDAKRIQQLAEINELTEQVNLLEAELKLVEKASVKVGKAIHDGVEIQIGKQTWNVREETGGGTYKILEGCIVLT